MRTANYLIVCPYTYCHISIKLYDTRLKHYYQEVTLRALSRFNPCACPRWKTDTKSSSKSDLHPDEVVLMPKDIEEELAVCKRNLQLKSRRNDLQAVTRLLLLVR